MEEKEMKEKKETRSVVNHYEPGSNCQVFNGNNYGCVFAMPGANVTQQVPPQPSQQPSQQPSAEAENNEPQPSSQANHEPNEELFHFIHPSVDEDQEWAVHREVKRLVKRNGVQEICLYLKQMATEKKVLLPQMPSVAYAELVRMGMPCGEGFNESTFRKYYVNK